MKVRNTSQKSTPGYYCVRLARRVTGCLLHGHFNISSANTCSSHRRLLEARHPHTSQLPPLSARNQIRNPHLPSKRPLQSASPPILIAPLLPPQPTELTQLPPTPCRPKQLIQCSIQTGEICLDLLKTTWSPAYTITTTLTSIHQLLTSAEPDSPLNIDVAQLLRQGDEVGAESLIRFYTETERWEGR